MSTSKSALIQAFESTPTIDGKYSNLFCVNFRPGDTQKLRGGYSLVFRAEDLKSGNRVAIKIMDPDYLSDLYRMDCFTREAKIIEGIQSHSRCLRLVDGHKVFDIDVSLSTGHKLKYPVGFFVTEWLDEHIEDYFFKQSSFKAAIKLEVFRQMVLAVKALHDQGVHHRDLKRDNLRARSSEPGKPIVAIDLGTAAKLGSAHLATSYGAPVGHTGYAPPEAFCGFAGVRELGPAADAYALGALLYELFMPDFFFVETTRNPVFMGTLHALIHKAVKQRDLKKRLDLWRVLVRDFARAVQPPAIGGAGSTLPDAAKAIVVGLYTQLAAFDLAKRLTRLDIAIRRIDAALRSVLHPLEWNRLQQRRKKARLERIAELQTRARLTQTQKQP
jgi:serine/threonine protein kinase